MRLVVFVTQRATAWPNLKALMLLAITAAIAGPAFGQSSDFDMLLTRLEATGVAVHVGYRNQQGELVDFEWTLGRGGSILLRTQMFLTGRGKPMPTELEDFDRDGKPDIWRFLDPAANPQELRLPHPQERAALFMWNVGVSEAARLIRRQSNQ